MDYDTFIDVLRLIDAVLASAVFGIIVFRTKRYWKMYDRPQQYLIMSYLGFTLAVSYTSFELYAQQTSIGFRSYIVFAASAFALFAIITNKKPGLLNFDGKPLERKDRNPE